MVDLRRWSPAAAAGLALLTLALVGRADFLPDGVRAVLAGLSLLQAPGFVVARALGLIVTRTEGAGLFFSLSIAALLPGLLWGSLVAGSLGSTLPALVLVLAIATIIASSRSSLTYRSRARPEAKTLDTRILVVIAVALGLAITGAAWILTESGAVDRWWYLAYVRNYVSSDALRLTEPFFGSDFVHPRFSINAWLLLLAGWARLAAVDPVFLYERVAPLFAVPIALSAARLLAGSIFSSPRTVWTAVVATALLWSGGSLFPIITRSVEDKILAALILAPVSLAAVSRAMSRRSGLWIAAAALALAAQSTVHPVVYAFTALTALPYIGLMAAGRHTKPAVALALMAALAIGAVYPVVNGSQARELMAADGATLDQPQHPVVRVHRSRDRLIEFESGGYIVNPRLLVHPIVLFGIFSLLLLGRRSRQENFFLIPATLLPLFICFVPPMAELAGQSMVPWMLYRVLWAAPYALLAAAGLEACAASARVPVLAGTALLAAGVLPYMQSTISERSAPARLAQIQPAGELDEVLRAMRALDEDAIVAAAPELAERLPALTGARVLAMSDRATTVFTGSRAAARPRLRANAMIAAGLWRPSDDVPTPTHILIEPGDTTDKYCAERLHNGELYALCTFEPAPSRPGVSLAEAASPVNSEKSVTHSYAALSGNAAAPLAMSCTPEPATRGNRLVWERPGPWTARYPGLLCRVTVGRNEPTGRMIAERLALTAFVGTAVDEYIVEMRAFDDLGQRWSVRTRADVSETKPLEFQLPRAHAHTFEVAVVPTYLPFVKLEAFELTFAKGMIASLGGIALDTPQE